MDIHHIIPTPLQFVPITEEIKALPLQDKAIYVFMKEDIYASTPGKLMTWQQAGNKNSEKEFYNALNNYTHIAIVIFPNILPDIINQEYIVTNDQYLDQWVENCIDEIFKSEK